MLSLTENEIYDMHLESILTFTGGAHTLKKIEVQQYTGRSKDYVRDHILRKGSTEISAENLARWLMKL